MIVHGTLKIVTLTEHGRETSTMPFEVDRETLLMGDVANKTLVLRFESEKQNVELYLAGEEKEER